MIYQVECRIMMVVEAEDSDSAEKIAEDNIHLEDQSNFEYCTVRRIESVKQLPYKWCGACLPYGREDDLTLSQLLQTKD